MNAQNKMIRKVIAITDKVTNELAEDQALDQITRIAILKMISIGLDMTAEQLAEGVNAEQSACVKALLKV